MSELHKGRLLMLAAKIEDPEATPEFGMEDYTTSCGAPLCVAGWAVHFWGNLPAASETFDVYDQARDILGLVDAQAIDLFHGRAWPNKFIENITRANVAVELRRLAAIA